MEVPPSQPGHADRRRAPRHATESQASSLGDVMDLSRVGARVGGRGRPPLRVGETVTLGLHAPEGMLRVPGRVVWIRRPRFRQWEMGLEFVDVDRRKQVAVERLAKYGCLTVPGDDSRDAGGTGSTRGETVHRFTPPGARVTASFREPDHYRMLQVQPDADDETIRLAFRTLAKRMHPDRNPSPDARRCFEALKQAYDALRDPRRRAAYDARRTADGDGEAAGRDAA